MNPDVVPGKEELLFLPLGGTGEIGMNLNLYGHDGAWLMVDLGITFAGQSLPGVDVLMPDSAFIEDRSDRLAGLILTHAHEDHIGAVPYLWPLLRCPIYATAFTAELVRGKLAEAGLLEEAEVTVVPLSGQFKVGPFDIELITLTHSIPEPNALVIRCAAGTVLHTGDWKLDETPLVGESYDRARLQALAKENVRAMVCDSTNALVAGAIGSEADVRDRLMEVVGNCRNRVAMACFASNVARLETALQVAKAHGRRVALIGRSMHRIVAAAQATGYLQGLPPFIGEEDVGYLPRSEVMLLCTGSQGERRSALWRIAHDDHPQVELAPGDSVIFSSRVIPGNEVAISELQNALVNQKIEIITADDDDIHVSGHPGRDELAQMYQWVRPEIAIPVHGEARHLAAHAELAATCQVPQQLVGANGSLMRLAPGEAGIIGQVPTGRLAYDGRRLLPVESQVIKNRLRMSYNGSAFVTLVMDGNGTLDGDPEVSFHGLMDPEEDQEDHDWVVAAVSEAVAKLTRRERRDDDAVKDAARLAVRRTLQRIYGRKPVTSVHLVRLY